MGCTQNRYMLFCAHYGNKASGGFRLRIVPGEPGGIRGRIMAELLFKCAHCGKMLAIDSQGVGLSVNCTDCGQPTTVPAAAIEYRCPQCRAKLCAPLDLAGTACSCPACGHSSAVPAHSPILSLRRSRETGADDADAAPGQRCPACGATAAPAAILCVQCGINLRTGKPFLKQPHTSVFGSVWFHSAAMLLLLAALGWGWQYHRHIKEERAERVLQAKQEAVEKQRAEEAERVAEAKRKQADEARRLAAEETRRRLAEEQAKHAQEKRRMAELRERFLQTPEVGLLDAMSLFVVGKDPVRLSIDPEVLGLIQDLRVTTEEKAALATRAGREAWFSKKGLIVRDCPLSEPNQLVEFVTTESIWSYFCAVQQMRGGRLNQALQVLNAARLDDSDYGKHCLGLRTLLAELDKRRIEMSRLDQQVNQRLAASEQHYRGANMAKRAAAMSSGGEYKVVRGKWVWMERIGDVKVMQASAISRNELALRELRAVASDMNDFMRKADLANRMLVDRHNFAFAGHFMSEVSCLLKSYIDTFDRLNTLSATISKTGLLSEIGWKSAECDALRGQIRGFRAKFPEIPDDLRQHRDNIEKDVRAASNQTRELHLEPGAIRDSLYRDMMAAGRALSYDRGNVYAHVAAGYYRLQLHAKELQNILHSSVAPEDNIKTLAHEFDVQNKQGLLSAARWVADKTSSPPALSAGKVGMVTGLSLSGSEGELFPITVQIKSRVKSRETETVTVSGSTGNIYTGYWESWSASWSRENITVTEPIIFEDYGKKDLDMCISTVEAYKYLVDRFPAMTNQAMHISFHALKEDKGGDSAGLTMALAAYSSLFNKPVRPDIATTGSIRSDGSVLAVGGIFEKLLAAAAAPGIELVIIPKGNEPDAMLLPLDTLCRIAIVSASEIEDCFDFVTDQGNKAEALAKLRRAQVHLLAGQRDRAEPLLLEVAAECPELYNARRLLELIAFWNKTKSEDRRALNATVAPAEPARGKDARDGV